MQWVAPIIDEDFEVDDSGATEHHVEPILCDAYEAFLVAFGEFVTLRRPLPEVLS